MADENVREEADLIHRDEDEVVIDRANAKRCVTVEPASILMYISIGCVTSITQQYVYQRLGQEKNITVENENSSKYCREGDIHNMSNYDLINEVQKEASYILASFKAVSLVPMMFSAVMLGSYSDRIGRKVILVLPIIGLCVRIGILALVIFLHMNMYYLHIGMILEGFLGGSVLFLCGVFSYISDITTTKRRTLRVIILECCSTVGWVISQLGIGYLIKYHHILISVLIILGCAMINLVYVVFFVQESIERSNGDQVKFWTVQNPKRVAMLYIRDTAAHRRWKLQISLVLITIVVFYALGKSDVIALYVLGLPFCLTSVMLGYYMAWSSIVPGILGTAVTKFCERRLSEIPLFIICGISSLVNCILTALVPNVIWLFVGALFSSIAWVEQASSVIGAVSLDSFYAATVSVYSGLALFVMAGVVLLTIIIGGVVAWIENLMKKRLSEIKNINSAEADIPEDEGTD